MHTRHTRQKSVWSKCEISVSEESTVVGFVTNNPAISWVLHWDNSRLEKSRFRCRRPNCTQRYCKSGKTCLLLRLQSDLLRGSKDVNVTRVILISQSQVFIWERITHWSCEWGAGFPFLVCSSTYCQTKITINSLFVFVCVYLQVFTCINYKRFWHHVFFVQNNKKTH